MSARLLALVRKELLQILRDRRTLAIIVLMPVIQLVLFGYAINTTVDHIPAVVYDEAGDAESRAFVQAFVHTGYFDLVGVVRSREEAQRALDEGRARVAFVLPPGFGRDLLAGRPARAQVLIDGSDPNLAQTALFTAGSIGQAQASAALARRLERAGLGRAAGIEPSALELRPLVLYNPSMSSTNFMIPGLIGLILQMQTLLLTAFAVVRERERGTLEQLIVTPIRPLELMLGKILPYVAIGLLNVGLVLAVGVFGFRAVFNGSLALLLACAFVFLLGSLGIGLLVSTVSHTQAQAMQLAMFAMLPSFLLSGFAFQREAMPPAIYALGYLIPLTYFLHILRGIMLRGVGLEALWGDLLPMATFSVLIFLVSVRRFRKRLG